MASTPEAKVKDKIKKIIKDAGGYYALPVMTGMAQNGTPDILACIKGTFLGIEAKAGRGKVTKIQVVQLRKIDAAQGLAVVVNEKNLDAFKELVNAMVEGDSEFLLRVWQANCNALTAGWLTEGA